MRLRRLRIKSYGHFRDLDAPLDGDGVQMIVGPNEAGKTTLLEFVRELLFGIDERTRYRFGEKSKPEGAATLVLDSGAIVELNRRKGRRNTVSVQIDGSESNLDEAGFNGLLGHASENLFRSIFAFGLDELAAGEKSLGDQSVKSALYSGGAAGAVNPKKVIEALQSEADKYYKLRSKTLVIDRALDEISALTKQIKEKSVRCDAYHQRQNELNEAVDEAAEASERLRLAVRELGLRRRLARAFPHWLALGRLRSERAGLSAPEGFPADGRARVDGVEKEIVRLAEEIENARKASEEAARELADLRFDSRLIDRRSEIEGLNQAIQAVKDARRNLPLDQRKHDESIRRIKDRIDALAPGWSLDDLREFRPTAEILARVDALTTEREERAAALAELARARGEHLETLHDKESALAELGEAVDASSLTSIVGEEAEYKGRVKAAHDLERARRATQRDVDDLLPRLNPPLERPTCDAVDLPTPPRASVARFKEDFRRIDLQVHASEATIERDEATLEGLKNELAGLSERGGDLPTREGLADLRRRRDLGWELVRRKHVDHEAVEREAHDWLADNAPDSVHDLLDAYRSVVVKADRYADDLFNRSSAVHKNAEVQAALRRIEEQRASLAGLKSVRESRGEDWRDLWADCGVEPLPPEEMEGWLDRLDELRELRRRRDDQEQDGRTHREFIARFEARLRALLDGGDHDGPTLLAAARERENRIRSDEQARRDLGRALRQLRDRIDRVDAKRADLRVEEADWSDRWRLVLQELRLPLDWDAGLAGKVIRDLKSTFADLGAADDLADRIVAHKARLAEFEPRVRAVAVDLAPDLAAAVPESAAADLQSRLTETLQARERKASLEKNRAESQRREREREAKRAAALGERAALFEAAAVDSVEEFRAVADRAARIVELDREINDQEKQLDVFREQEPLSDFVARLDGAHGDDLKAELDRAEAFHGELERRTRTADENVGSRRRALSEFEKGSGEAAELQEAASAKRAELAAAVDRYVPLVFARGLLQKAVQRFESESQPEVLRESSRIFQTMTGGRYTRVERPRADDDAALLVHRVDDETLEPSQLSTGTREQLYLAVRLAYALHYCGRAESLPIVMDDVLANFDDDRARRTLLAFGEVADRVQVILFTCHPHFIALGREVFPGLRPLSMPDRSAEPEKAGRPQRIEVDASI